MKPESKKLLVKAGRALRAAGLLLRDDAPDFAAGRAYYAMFYAAEAVLAERDLQFRKHSGVHAAFGEHLAKPGLLNPKLHRWLLDAFDKRILGDYSYEMDVDDTAAREMLDQAREFVSAVETFLGSD
ncbi:MAG TPA: HEPN domain-containing protein [bacterium]|nr:HEPN domain-containing protein [bacterium]